MRDGYIAYIESHQALGGKIRTQVVMFDEPPLVRDLAAYPKTTVLHEVIADTQADAESEAWAWVRSRLTAPEDFKAAPAIVEGQRVVVVAEPFYRLSVDSPKMPLAAVVIGDEGIVVGEEDEDGDLLVDFNHAGREHVNAGCVVVAE